MTKTQVQKLHTLTGHRDSIYALQLASVSNIFFSGAGDGMVVKWDLTNPEEGELVAKLPNSIYALHHLPQDDLLVAGQNYSGIHLLDWKSKRELASLQITNAAIFDIQSFNENLFISSGEGMLTIVDLEKWVIKKKIPASEKSARAIAINPPAGEIAVAYSDHYIRVFSFENFELKKQWPAHLNSVFTLAYSPDYKVLFSGSRDARFKTWAADLNYELKEEVIAHLFAINHIVFSPDAKHFVTCSMDKSIKVWDAAELKLLKVIDKARHAGHGTSVNKLLWTSFNNQLISAGDDRTISVWHLIF